MRKSCVRVVCVLIASMVGGCHISRSEVEGGHKVGRKSVEDITGARSSLLEVEKQIVSVLDSLNALEKSMATSVHAKDAFMDYSTKVKAVRKGIDKTKELARKLNKDDALFREWEVTMGVTSDEEMKARTEARRPVLVAEYERIRGDARGAGECAEQFWRDLADLDTFYASDLSPSAIRATSDLVARANSDGEKCRELVDEMVKEIDAVLSTIGSK